MQDFEKLGVFYLGKRYEPAAAGAERAGAGADAGAGGAVLDEPVLYDARDLTTHAVCVGMTGSGKTGLCLGLLEEAALDGIPVIAIDPKGDLGNLLLTFPELRAADFRPWVDEGEAARAGLPPDAFAAQTAEGWRKGLADSGQDGARIARLRAAADFAIYTPGSNAGLPLSILRSLAAPPPALLADEELLRDRVAATASSLLALLGIEADPRQSREHILLSRLAAESWQQGRDLDLAGLIRQIQSPPFERVGMVDVESFFPARERAALAMRLNNLLASPGFEAWLTGEPLDVQRLLWTPEGRPRVAILSIAHLADAERMFFVTLLLNEVVAWMRGQPGTSSLRAILSMDEVFGFFPPVANPPAKGPMLTLLKQARAFGVGVVLATQNPVDLDYKGLSNAGTWFLGRLQTERDRDRVLDGLEGAAATAGRAFDRARIETLLSSLPKRTFLLHNVHEEQPVLFQTRFTLSYLRGPLTRPQIRALTEPRPAGARGAAATAAATTQAATAAPAAAPAAAARAASAAPASNAGAALGGERPLLPPDVQECFLPAGGAGAAVYLPRMLGAARVHYADSKRGVDVWQDVTLLAPIDAEGSLSPWEQAEERGAAPRGSEPAPGARFAKLPAAAARSKSWAGWRGSLADHLYRNRPLRLVAAPALKLVSRPGESEGDFRARTSLALRELRDAEMAKLQQRYAPKLRTLQDRLARAEERQRREQGQLGQRRLETGLSIGATLLGALFGRKAASVSNLGRASTAMRNMGRTAHEQGDVAAAQESVASLQQQLADLQAESSTALSQLGASMQEPALEPVAIAPRKSDIAVESLVLAWVPAPLA